MNDRSRSRSFRPVSSDSARILPPESSTRSTGSSGLPRARDSTRITRLSPFRSERRKTSWSPGGSIRPLSATGLAIAWGRDSSLGSVSTDRGEGNPTDLGGTGQRGVEHREHVARVLLHDRQDSCVRGDVPADRLDDSGPVPADGEREGVIQVAAGRQGEPVNEIIAPGESDAAIGLRGECEEANDVSPRGRGFENDPRVAAHVVVILGQHEPIRRDDLQDGIHRRAEVSLRLHSGDERLAASQVDRETVHVARLGEAAIDRHRSDAEALR